MLWSSLPGSTSSQHAECGNTVTPEWRPRPAADRPDVFGRQPPSPLGVPVVCMAFLGGRGFTVMHAGPSNLPSTSSHERHCGDSRLQGLVGQTGQPHRLDLGGAQRRFGSSGLKKPRSFRQNQISA